PRHSVITSSGMDGQLTITSDIVIPSVITFSGTIHLEFSNTTSAVHQTFTINGDTTTIDLAAGPFVRVNITNAHATVLGYELNCSFKLELVTNKFGQKVVRVAASGVSLNLQNVVILSNGQG